jgi:hypothetical protein
MNTRPLVSCTASAYAQSRALAHGAGLPPTRTSRCRTGGLRAPHDPRGNRYGHRPVPVCVRHHRPARRAARPRGGVPPPPATAPPEEVIDCLVEEWPGAAEPVRWSEYVPDAGFGGDRGRCSTSTPARPGLPATSAPLTLVAATRWSTWCWIRPGWPARSPMPPARTQPTSQMPWPATSPPEAPGGASSPTPPRAAGDITRSNKARAGRSPSTPTAASPGGPQRPQLPLPTTTTDRPRTAHHAPDIGSRRPTALLSDHGAVTPSRGAAATVRARNPVFHRRDCNSEEMHDMNWLQALVAVGGGLLLLWLAPGVCSRPGLRR